MTRSMTLGMLVLFAAGCATAPGGDSSTPQAISARELPRTIAVLPFKPLPEKEEQARVLTSMIYGALSATPYDVLKLQVVEERLARAGLADPAVANAKPPAELAKVLGVEGIVYGELTHWDRIYLAVYSQVAAGGHVRLVDARSGQTLFERKEVSRTHEGGLPTNPMSAAITVIQTALKLREIELIRACDDLVRGLTKGVPVPPADTARRPPALTNVVADGKDRLLKTGDVVTVIAQGQQGVIGSFDVVPVAKGLAMEETGEGVFVGRYTVKPGDNGKETYVVVRLTDSFGRVAEREDVLGRFSVDTESPATPGGLAVGLRERAVHVSWAVGSEPDLAGYRVYRSDSQLTGFAPVGTVEAPAFRDELTGMRYYRVSALDRAGNESAPSASVGLPVLPAVLRGAVVRESYLVPANSPYVVEGRVSVEEGAALHILPGVVVRLAPGADGILVKDGRLLARGTPAAPVRFTSGSERPAAGDYRTAVQVHAKAGQVSVLEHVVVEHAGVAVRVVSGGLEVLGAEIAGNRQGGIEVSETGVVKLSQSRIASHTSGAGVTVQGFARVTLRGNGITGNAWAVVNYSGNQVDARENWWGTATPDDALFIGDVDRRAALAEAPGARK